MTGIIIGLVVISSVLILAYSMCVVAGQADRQLEEYEAADRGEPDEV